MFLVCSFVELRLPKHYNHRIIMTFFLLIAVSKFEVIKMLFIRHYHQGAAFCHRNARNLWPLILHTEKNTRLHTHSQTLTIRAACCRGTMSLCFLPISIPPCCKIRNHLFIKTHFPPHNSVLALAPVPPVLPAPGSVSEAGPRL